MGIASFQPHVVHVTNDLLGDKLAIDLMLADHRKLLLKIIFHDSDKVYLR